MEHRAHPQLDPGPRAPLRPLPATSWCSCQRPPTVRQLRGRPGAWSASQCLRTELQSCTSGRTSRRRACPTRRQERWTSTASRSWTRPWRRHGGGGGGHGGFGAAAEARVPRRRGRRRHAGLGEVPRSPRKATSWCAPAPWPRQHGGRLPAGGLRHDPERLRLEHCAHLHADALLLRLPVQAGPPTWLFCSLTPARSVLDFESFAGRGQMLDGRVLGASVEYKPFGKLPLKREHLRAVAPPRGARQVLPLRSAKSFEAKPSLRSLFMSGRLYCLASTDRTAAGALPRRPWPSPSSPCCPTNL